MRLLFHTIGSLSPANQQFDDSAETVPAASDIRRNGKRSNTVSFVPRPAAQLSGTSRRRPYWSTTKMQTRLAALRRAS
jgi:hypothetical protein